MISRIAPTPSGYLHMGNAYNFLLTWLYIRHHGGVLWLRLDDLDFRRCRPKYIEGIFRDLEWLGLEWNKGPTSVRDATQHSQHNRMNRYNEILSILEDHELTFGCSCSRKQILARSPDGRYPMTCRDKAPLGDKIWRFSFEKVNTLNILGMGECHPKKSVVVLRNREGFPSYQLACVVDDHDYGVNLIVRGADLYGSSVIQEILRSYLGFRRDILHIHHPLIMNSQGKKLSKSIASSPIAELRAAGESVGRIYSDFARWLRWPKQPDTLEGLRLGFAQWEMSKQDQ